MATKQWTGNAVAVKDVWTITPGGTIASGSTFTLSINGKSIVYTSTGSTVAGVTAGIAALWNNTETPPPPEFRELVAVDNTTSVTLTGRLEGRPHTVGAAAGGSGSPSVSISNTTPATGPNFISAAANWSDNAAPANSDVLVIDSGTIPILYGFDALDALTGVTVRILEGYQGVEIGLPNDNNDGDYYFEYRTKELTLDGGTIEVNCSTLQRLRVNTQSTAATYRIINTGQRLDALVPVVLITGNHSSNTIDVTRGDVAIAFYPGQTSQFPTVRMAFANNQASDSQVFIGPDCTLTTISKTGGILTTNSNVTTLSQQPNGGTMRVEAGAVTTLNVDGGTCIYNSTGTLGTGRVSNEGFLDFDQDSRPKTVTNPVELFGDRARVRDSRKVVNSGALVVDLNHTQSMANIAIGPNVRVTLGTPS